VPVIHRVVPFLVTRAAACAARAGLLQTQPPALRCALGMCHVAAATEWVLAGPSGW